MGNMFKTAFLLTAMTLLLLFFGRYFGGENGMFLALAFAAVMNFVSYFYSDKIALAAYRAQPVTREQLPRAYAAVERLTQKIGIPMPKIYVIPSESPNAFATGRNPSHASVAVTHGILGLLTDEELEGVLAHGTVCHALWRLWRPRSRSQWRRLKCPLHADRRANRRYVDSTRSVALA